MTKNQNTPSAAPQNEPVHPVDRVIKKMEQEKLSYVNVRDELDALNKELREKNVKATEDQLKKLREKTTAETSAEATEKGLESAVLTQSLNELDTRLALIEEAAKAPPAEPPLFSKEGMKKAFDGSMKNLGETLTALAVVLDQLREQIAVSIGGSLDMLKSFIGEKKVNMLKGFIGEDRIQLSKTLNAAKITLPMAAFIQARKSIEAVRGETAANVRGWTAERMSFVLVEKLKLAGVTGKEVEGDLEQKITDAVKILRAEVLATPLNGNGVNFAEAGQQPELRLSNATIADKSVNIMSDGSMTVAGQKWRLEQNGQKIAVKSAVFENKELKITTETYQTIVLSQNLDDIINDLAIADSGKQKIAPANEKGEIIIEFIRTS